MSILNRTAKFIGKETGSYLGRKARDGWQKDRKEVLKTITPKKGGKKKW